MSAGSAWRCVVRTRPLALTVAAAALLAACATSGRAAGGGPTVPSSITTTPTVADTPTGTDTPTVAPTTSEPPSTSSAVTSVPPTTSTPTPRPQRHTTCTSVTVRVLPGGASFGEEIAAVQFVNSGVKTCVLVGYPTVTLFLRGKRIGDPSQPASVARSMRTLHPGDVAESLLHDYTQTCQAPLSDSVKVQVPGTSITYVRPHMQLRACVLRVDKLGAPD